MSKVVANLNSVNISELSSLIATSARIGQTIFLSGGPGCGKTAITRDVLEKEGRHVLYECAAYLTQINIGLPVPDGDALKVLRERRWFTEYSKPLTIIVDEVDKMSPMMQQQVCQLAHEQRLGDDHLPKGTSVVLIGNRSEDGNGSYGTSNILTSRTLNVAFEPEPDEIFAYGQRAGWHPLILSVLQMNKSLCYKPSATTDRFPAPRTWENASDFLYAEPNRKVWDKVLSGFIGDASAGEALAYIEAYEQLVPADECLAKPKTAQVPESPHVQMLQSFIVAQQAREGQLPAVLDYLQRFPAQIFMSGLTAMLTRVKHTGSSVHQELLEELNKRDLIKEIGALSS